MNGGSRTLLQRGILSCFYVLFIQILLPEDDLRATLYPFSHKLDFNFVVKYVFACEKTFYESAKLNPPNMANPEQFLKISRNVKISWAPRFVSIAYLPYLTLT